MFVQQTEEHSRLFNLAGMKYASGSYTAEQWQAKTGVNPLDFPKYIKITRTGLCIWTDHAEKLYSAHIDNVRGNWACLGIAS
jgi:hypothetical protein